MLRKYSLIALLCLMLMTGIGLYMFKVIGVVLLGVIIAGCAVLLTLNFLEIGDVKKQEVEKLNREAEDLYSRNELNNARKAFEKALKLDPDAYEARLGIAQCHRMLLESEKAMENFQKAVDLDPDRHEAYFFLGIVQLHSNKLDEALDAFKKVESIKSDFEDLYYLVGEVYEKRKEIDRAIEYYGLYVERCKECRLREGIIQRIAMLSGDESDEESDEEFEEEAPSKPVDAREEKEKVEKMAQALKTEEPVEKKAKPKKKKRSRRRSPLMLNLKLEIGEDSQKDNDKQEEVTEEKIQQVKEGKVQLDLDESYMSKVMKALDDKGQEKSLNTKNN